MLDGGGHDLPLLLVVPAEPAFPEVAVQPVPAQLHEGGLPEVAGLQPQLDLPVGGEGFEQVGDAGADLTPVQSSRFLVRWPKYAALKADMSGRAPDFFGMRPHIR